MELERLQAAVTEAKNRNLAGFRGGGGTFFVRLKRKTQAKAALVLQAENALAGFLEQPITEAPIVQPQPVRPEPETIIPVTQITPLPQIGDITPQLPMITTQNNTLRNALIVGGVLLLIL